MNKIGFNFQILFLFSLVFVSAALLLFGNAGATGKVADNTIISGNLVNLEKQDVIYCCSFIDNSNEIRTCNVLSRFSCDYCSTFCTP